jgi:hypothetical protein
MQLPADQSFLGHDCFRATGPTLAMAVARSQAGFIRFAPDARGACHSDPLYFVHKLW